MSKSIGLKLIVCLGIGSQSAAALEFKSILSGFPTRYLLVQEMKLMSSPSRQYNVESWRASNNEWDNVLITVNDNAPLVPDLGAYITIRDDRQHVLQDINFSGVIKGVRTLDFNGDGIQDIILTTIMDSSSLFHLIDGSSDDTVFFEIQSSRYPVNNEYVWDIVIGARFAVVPAGEQDKFGLAVSLYSGSRAYPRQVIMLDPMTGREYWHYDVNGNIVDLHLVDIDGENRALLLSTYGSCNRSDTVETVLDKDGDIILLDLTGRVIWRRTIQGPYTGVYTRVIPGQDGASATIIAFVWNRNSENEPRPGNLMLLDISTGETLKDISIPMAEEDQFDFFVFKTASQKDSRIVVSARPRGVYVFDASLKRINKWPQMSMLTRIGDVTCNNNYEMFAADMEIGQTLVYSNEGTLLARFQELTSSQVLQRGRDTKYPFIWGYARDGLVKMRLDKNDHYYLDIAVWIIINILIPFGALAVIAFGPVLIWRFRYRRKETEKEMYELENKHLEEKYRLTERAEKLNEDLTLNRIRALELTSLHHKVKNALQSIISASQNLKQELEHLHGTIQPEYVEYFKTFDTQVRKVREISEKIRQTGKLSFRKRELIGVDLLVKMAEDNCPNYPQIRFLVRIDTTLPQAYVDPAQFIEVLNNLILNSIQSIEEDGTIEITATTARGLLSRQDDKSISLTIVDNGSGIPEDVQPFIFDPYFTTKSSGTGLGLYISKKIIEDHGGRLSIKSEPGQGTSATIIIPILS